MAVVEDLFQSEIELAEVVLPESVLVPAADVQEQALDSGDWQVALFVPLGVEGFVYGMGDMLGFTESNDEVRIGCTVSVLRCEVPSLEAYLLASVVHVYSMTAVLASVPAG